ncbi:TonB-dependent receptor plug domain-containing protein [Emcibacter sp.]|uniref:TonB-dependent receptor plug domain-containing protein n=1 Tax=Emcibacter sp. TaxID=1979954 RepID=UPI003A91665E
MISKLISSVSAIAFMTASASATYAQQTDTSAQASEEAFVFDEIVVTGTSIRGVPPVGSNLIGVSREDIETIGAATTPDLLATVPQLNSFNTAPQASRDGYGSFAPGLRGLPTSATLVLMNGHRLASGAANETSPDYPFLPSLAIERVEIVADGASSIYGSDAIAGVVNFITRKRYSGVEASVNYGMADDYDAFTINGLVGHEWEKGSVLAAYQYMENDNITGGERDYRSLDYREAGGIDARSTSCASPNVLVDTSFYLVNYAAPDLAPNTVNYCDNGAVADLFPKSRMHSAFVTAQQQLSEDITLWGELLYSDRKDEIRVAPAVQTVVLTNTNPFFQAPPGSGATTELVLFRPDNLVGADHRINRDHKKVGNSSAGIDVTLPRDLNLSVYGTYDWATNDAFIPTINTAALGAAAAGTTPETALDPFGNGTSQAVIDAILDSATYVTVKQRTYMGAVKIDGPLMDLPAGELKIAAGAEYRRETFQQRGFVGTIPVPEDLDRNIYSVFGELFVPIIGEDSDTPFIRSLSLSLSGRYDHYSDFGSTTNPKIGVSWEPMEGVTVRGTYGRSFKAPGMREIGATVGAYYLTADQAASLARDPSRGAAQVNTVYLLGGNLDLQPEKARTYSFGVDWQPTFLPEIRTSLTFYDIRYTEVIGTPPVSLIFTDPTFQTVVYRDPTVAELNGLLSGSNAVPVNLPSPLPAIGNLLDQRRGNFGVIETKGMDFDINYWQSTDFGAIFAGVAGNYIFNYETRLSPSAPVTDNLKFGIPRATVRVTAGFAAGSVGVSAFVNYRDGITNTFATPTGTSEYKSGSYTTVDLRVSWTLPDTSFASGTQLNLQVNDLFDKKPPFFPGTDGIGGNYNPIGRYIALNLKSSF